MFPVLLLIPKEQDVALLTLSLSINLCFLCFCVSTSSQHDVLVLSVWQQLTKRTFLKRKGCLGAALHSAPPGIRLPACAPTCTGERPEPFLSSKSPGQDVPLSLPLSSPGAPSTSAFCPATPPRFLCWLLLSSSLSRAGGPPRIQSIPTGLGPGPWGALEFPACALGRLPHFQPENRQLSWNQKSQIHGYDPATAAAITNQSQPSSHWSLDKGSESPSTRNFSQFLPEDRSWGAIWSNQGE